MNERQDNNARFLAALARLETCFETPVVPGELPGWLATAKRACAEVGDTLLHEVERAHGQVWDEIARRDPALAPRVEAMKVKDEALRAQYQELYRELDRLCCAAIEAEPDEASLGERIANLVEQGLAFVIGSRTQERALTTWQMEAFDRDRGFAD